MLTLVTQFAPRRIVVPAVVLFGVLAASGCSASME